MKIRFTCLALLLLAIACKEQYRYEVAVMNCIYQNYQDGGIEFKNSIADYEKHLIGKGLLNDTSGKSYHSLMNAIAKNKNFEFYFNKRFSEELENLNTISIASVKNCGEQLQNKSEKLKEFNKLITAIHNSADVPESDELAKKIIALLDPDDLELDYYKLNLFLIFDSLQANTVMKPTPSENCFDIYLNEKSEIIYKNQHVSSNALSKKIKAYLLENKSTSKFRIQTENRTEYNQFLTIQNIITNEVATIRNTYSLEKYGTPFLKLDEEKSAAVKKQYPIDVSNL